MNEQVTAYISKAPSEQREIMELVRSLIHESGPDITEEFKWNRPIFKSAKDIAYLQASKNHVNLGFYGGFEKLNDPDGLLEGTGKTMRHIKLRTVSAIDKALLSEWFTILSKG